MIAQRHSSVILICWSSHVGVYAGYQNYNGKSVPFLIDAANKDKDVVEQPVWKSNGYYKVIRLIRALPSAP
jgi:hypothetical protein